MLFYGYHCLFFLCQESLEEKIQEVQKKLEELEKSAPEKADIKVNTLAGYRTVLIKTQKGRSWCLLPVLFFSSDKVLNTNTANGEEISPLWYFIPKHTAPL